MNDLAIEAIGQVAPPTAVPASELAPGLRGLVADGVVRHGAALVFAGHVDHVGAPRSGVPDLTGWECATSSFHLDDVVPVHVGSLEDGEPVISDMDQVLMLRHWSRWICRVGPWHCSGGVQVDHLYEDEADHAQSLGAAAVLDEIAKGRHLRPGHPVRRTAHHFVRGVTCVDSITTNR
jgi:hypothetical protein